MQNCPFVLEGLGLSVWDTVTLDVVSDAIYSSEFKGLQ